MDANKIGSRTPSELIYSLLQKWEPNGSISCKLRNCVASTPVLIIYGARSSFLLEGGMPRTSGQLES